MSNVASIPQTAPFSASKRGFYFAAWRWHFQIGDRGDRLIEIAAGFGVGLIITGLYMWWPRRGERFSDVLIRRRTPLKKALS